MHPLHVAPPGSLNRDLGEGRLHGRHPVRKRFEGSGDAPHVVEGSHQPRRGGCLPEPASVLSSAFPVRFELEIQVSRAQPAGLREQLDPVLFAAAKPAAFATPADGGDQARQQRLRQVPENRFHVGQSRRFEGVEPQLDEIQRPGLAGGGVEAGAQVRHRPPGDRERQARSEMRGQQVFDRFLLVGAARSRTPEIAGGGFPVERGAPLEDHHRLVLRRDARQRGPAGAVLGPREPLPQVGHRRPRPVDGPQFPQPGYVLRGLHDPPAAVHHQPLPGNPRQYRAFFFPEPFPAEPLDERGDRTKAGLQQFVGADPRPADPRRELPGGSALARSPGADQNDVGESGPPTGGSPGGAGRSHYPFSRRATWAPSCDSASQNPGNDFATTSGFRIRTPGTRRPVSASAIAIR